MTISHQINLVFFNLARLSTTSCQCIITYNPVFINPAWLWTISRQYIFGLRHWNHALIKHLIILFKFSNSQHGWILLWLSITSIMIKVFKVALAQWLSSCQWIWFILQLKEIVPSRCRLTTRHLGATLFKLRLHQICKSHVTASMHHDTCGLMQSHCLLTLLKTWLITS